MKGKVMLTKDELDGIAAMSQEERVRLLALIREARALFGGGMGMSAGAVKAMTDVVDDQQMRQIVAEHRHGRSEPGGLTDAPGPKERRSVPQKEVPLEARRDIRWIDQMCDVQDAIDKAERAKGLGAAFGGGPRVLTKDEAKEGR
jgi:hypothetical protein